MKKHIIAIIAIAGIVSAAEYLVNVSIPVKTEVVTTVTNVTESVTASVFVLERFIANVEQATNTTFVIHGSYRDANGKILKRKVIPIKMEQALQIMPSITNVMDAAQSVVETNIQNLLAE